jgi:PAS domain-containing protein
VEVQKWQEVERKQAEDALRASEALYHSLVETIPMNVWRRTRLAGLRSRTKASVKRWGFRSMN